MTTPQTAMVLASFVADSLALGAHWIYDTADIDRKFGAGEGVARPWGGFLSQGQGARRLYPLRRSDPGAA